MRKTISLLCSICILSLLLSCTEKNDIILSCNESNDLYKILKENKVGCTRYNTPQEAITNAQDGSAVMILADNYPIETTEIDLSLFDAARKKK